MLHPAGTAVPPEFVPPFSTGGILRQTFSVYGSNWGAFFIIEAVAFVPVLAAMLLLDSGSSTRFFSTGYFFLDSGSLTRYFSTRYFSTGYFSARYFSTGYFSARLIGFVTEPLAAGAIFFIVYEALHGRKASVPASLRAVSANLFQVVGASLLSSLAIWGGTFLLSSLAIWARTGVLIALGVVFAMGLLALVVPVAMQEKPGVMAALRRSAALAQGHRGQVVRVLSSLAFIAAVPLIAIVLIVDPSHTRALCIAPVAVVMNGLGATAITLMYDRLRRLKEESSAAGMMPPLMPPLSWW